MRLISTADDELYGLASTAGKFGRADKLLARLDVSRSADPPDGDAALRYGLAQMAVLPSIGVEFAAHARFTDTVAALGDALSLDPDNWLARYGRARLRALIPSSYGAYAVQLTGELAQAAEDLDHLIAAQSGCAPEPYFVSAHALAAVIDRLAGTAPSAGRPPLSDALAACPRVPVRFRALGAVLCEPLATLHAEADGAERELLGEVLRTVYGHQVTVDGVRRQPAGR
ncbi:hypothetical protein ACOT81_13085 [Streptomyces sp. WI04-05B]|uniref:hypothetical protein n=1 Tax=Streptomyces TaxID=1883 RepID=UPI0029BA1BB3|nr:MULTISPECIES: hypothetical protein [unclassified Streptomyces]MDX2545375.1 hypothetical protein [Streptomyces sp. WI04-05B]MDX2588130.1 hypothetical protein [Streptomyces sp. WI04-05A]MDX3749109.1 hypothetical protein [Streptomyces sp. AK08-02]